MKNLTQKQQGFTLVELAMVLTVIGMLVVGVIKGQEWFTNVKLYQLQSEFEEFESWINMYYIKTGTYPGLESGAYPNSANFREGFWRSLRAEGIIDGDASDGTPPTDSFGNIWVVASGGSGSSIFRRAIHICATGVKDVYAKGIDLKLDDGKGTTGRIKSLRYFSHSPFNLRDTSVIDYTENNIEMTVCNRMVRINSL